MSDQNTIGFSITKNSINLLFALVQANGSTIR